VSAGATRSRAQADAGTARAEHGEDGEDATLPAVSTMATLPGAKGITLRACTYGTPLSQ
jgi:hypothetical protein